MRKIRLTTKRKIVLLIIAVSITAIISVALFLSQPKVIINDAESYRIWRVMYNDEDITEQVDCEALTRIICNYKCSRLPYYFAPYQLSRVEVEINGDADNKPLHILLGEINVAYESADRGGYIIQNSEELLAEILELIQNS